MTTATEVLNCALDTLPKRKSDVPVTPAEAVLRLQPRFRRAAQRMTRDRHLRQDLVQEMSLAILRCENPNKLAWFRQLGYWRAMDYLRRVSDRPAQWIEKAARARIKLIRDREFIRVQCLTLAEG